MRHGDRRPGSAKEAKLSLYVLRFLGYGRVVSGALSRGAEGIGIDAACGVGHPRGHFPHALGVDAARSVAGAHIPASQGAGWNWFRPRWIYKLRGDQEQELIEH